MPEQKQRANHKKPTWIGYVSSWRFLLAFILLSVFLLGAMGIAAWRAAGQAGLMCGPVTAALGFGENWSKEAIEMTERRGQKIVEAIDWYRAEHGGVLPSTLDALVPDYLDAIETSIVGERMWSLGPLGNHENEYYLSVQSRYINQLGYYGIEFLQYNSLDKRWATFKSESLLFD